MTLESVYDKIRKHLAEIHGIKINPLDNPDYYEDARAPEYIVSIIAERLASLYSAIQTCRIIHSQSLLSFRGSLIHMLYQATGQLIEPSEISVNLTLALLADRLSTTSVADQPLIEQWMSKNWSKLSVLPDKTKYLAELHWHDLPNELFQDLVKPQSLAPVSP
ncbi:hypothetical protein DQ937_23845 [Salmonella enterica subsp. enterica serovar Poona]|nr:hypothetical protein [Salmonella enterica subsp. enterica serovar Poona]